MHRIESSDPIQAVERAFREATLKNTCDDEEPLKVDIHAALSRTCSDLARGYRVHRCMEGDRVLGPDFRWKKTDIIVTPKGPRREWVSLWPGIAIEVKLLRGGPNDPAELARGLGQLVLYSHSVGYRTAALLVLTQGRSLSFESMGHRSAEPMRILRTLGEDQTAHYIYCFQRCSKPDSPVS